MSPSNENSPSRFLSVDHKLPWRFQSTINCTICYMTLHPGRGNSRLFTQKYLWPRLPVSKSSRSSITSWMEKTQELAFSVVERSLERTSPAGCCCSRFSGLSGICSVGRETFQQGARFIGCQERQFERGDHAAVNIVTRYSIYL